MKTIIDGIQVTTEGELPEHELTAYVQRGREKYGRALISVELRPDGEYMDICYHTQKMPFERIRRITGYLVGTLDKWNDGKRAEEKDRVKHGVE
ncbi:MAG: hypothetical protein K5663_07845 [Clostridiales bacterium]|nr:hypothetical protein [Clostridiales bacterium]